MQQLQADLPAKLELKPTRHKYDRPMRLRVWGTIHSLYTRGKSPAEIAEVLCAEGLKLPDGKRPMTREYIIKTLYHFSRGNCGSDFVIGGPKVVTETTPPPTLPVLRANAVLSKTALSILTDPELNSDQKIRMLLAYADA